MPLIVRPAGNRDLCDLIHAHWMELQARLLEHGALLFRGFDVRCVEDFSRFIDATGLQRIDYLYRSTPRAAVADRIFNATEYPPGEEIALHNENSYQRDWPLKIAFSCLICAASGGSTPIGDMRRITATIGPEIFERFAVRGVRYVRHYHPHIDLSWQVAFQAETSADVTRFCREHDIDHEWLETQTLRTVQVAHGTAIHPETGEHLYFNQAHLFHVSSLHPAAAQSLLALFGSDRLPRHATYGTAEEIALEDLEAVRNAFRKHAISFPWQSGDVLLLDNMQIAHGRRPYSGERKVLAALLDAYSRSVSPRRGTVGTSHGESV
jgi:alpha-ketoglutarate-dependent taurine dioxygenase